MSVQRTVGFEGIRLGKVDWKMLSAALILTAAAATQATVEVARDDNEAGMKGLFKVTQFRAESNADE